MSDPDIDMKRLRPLEVRLRHRAQLPNGGISEGEANRYGRISADALVILRMLMDDGGLHLHTMTLEGETLGPISPSALFHLWVSFTGHLARTQVEADDEQGAQQMAFCQKVLLLLRLDPGMGALAQVTAGAEATEAPLHAEANFHAISFVAEGGEPLGATSDASEPHASTPAAPNSLPGDAPSSAG